MLTKYTRGMFKSLPTLDQGSSLPPFEVSCITMSTKPTDLSNTVAAVICNNTHVAMFLSLNQHVKEMFLLT